MFSKKTWKEGDHAFTSVQDGEFRNIVVGVVTGVEDFKIGINGIIINAVGLKNKVAQSKAGPQSIEQLKNPDPKDPWYGFHKFKMGYGPQLIEFVGSYDLVISPFAYQFYKVASKLRWIFLNLKK